MKDTKVVKGYTPVSLVFFTPTRLVTRKHTRAHVLHVGNHIPKYFLTMTEKIDSVFAIIGTPFHLPPLVQENGRGC
jgi:hypothetical protein